MKFTLLPFRYTLFALLLVSSAITCSVAVWNLSYTSFSAGQTLQVDAFLIFLGALLMLFMFIIIFTEMFRENAVTERLWFEVLWVTVFWIMELSGASALAAIAPNNCVAQGLAVGADVPCVSARVLLAFTWIPAILLMVYLALLLCGIIARQKRDPAIWHANAREFCRSPTKRMLPSAPVSPILPRFKNPVLDIVAPQPHKPATAYAHREGMGPEYGIEFYSPTGEHGLPAPPQPAQTVQRPRAAMPPAAVPVPSLYPIHLQSSVQPQRQAPVASSSSPPPLGNWPRADAVNQPVRKNSKRKPVPSAGLEAQPTADAPPAGTPSPAPANPPRHPRRKRTGSGEIQRPPPLDLSRISSFN